MFSKKTVSEWSKVYDSFYLYDENSILSNINLLKQNFKGVEFLYSLKSNPNKKIVSSILKEGLGADAASLKEVLLSNKKGLLADKILYSAPGKTVSDIEQAISASTIVADSLGEVLIINEVARKMDTIAKIGIRINPNFTFYGDVGIPSKFGIDEELAVLAINNWNNLENIDVIGIHVHSRSQELDYKVLANYYEKMFELAKRFQDSLGHKLEFINLGSGIGITYEKSDLELDLVKLGEKFTQTYEKYKNDFENTTIFIETGRFVVGHSGVYVTKVLDKKKSFGKTFVILANTLNGFMRPSIAKMVEGYANSDNIKPLEPLFTSGNAFEFIAINDETKQECVSLVGNLCTAADVVASDITMQKLNIGDVVVMTNAGSYAAVLSPMQFSSQTKPAQLFLARSGEVTNTSK